MKETINKKKPCADKQRQLYYRREELIASIEKDLKNIKSQLLELRKVRKVLKAGLPALTETTVGDSLQMAMS